MELFLKRKSDKFDIRVNGKVDKSCPFLSFVNKKHQVVNEKTLSDYFKNIITTSNVSNFSFDGDSLKISYLEYTGLNYNEKVINIKLDENLKKDENFLKYLQVQMEAYSKECNTWNRINVLNDRNKAVGLLNKFINNNKTPIFFNLSELENLRDYIDYLETKSIFDNKISNQNKVLIGFFKFIKGFNVGVFGIQLANLIFNGFAVVPMLCTIGSGLLYCGIDKYSKCLEKSKNSQEYHKMINLLKKEINNRKLDKNRTLMNELTFKGDKNAQNKKHREKINTDKKINRDTIFGIMINNLKTYVGKNSSVSKYKNDVKALEYIYNAYLVELQSVNSDIDFRSDEITAAKCSLLDRYVNLAIIISSKTNKSPQFYHDLSLPKIEEIMNFIGYYEVNIENNRYLRELIDEYQKEYGNNVDVTIKKLVVIKKIISYRLNVLKYDISLHNTLRSLKRK